MDGLCSHVGGMHEFEGGNAIRGGIHGVARALETAAQEIGDALFVFHYQESHNISLTGRTGFLACPRRVAL
jgi:hypothetical protein